MWMIYAHVSTNGNIFWQIDVICKLIVIIHTKILLCCIFPIQLNSCYYGYSMYLVFVLAACLFVEAVPISVKDWFLFMFAKSGIKALTWTALLDRLWFSLISEPFLQRCSLSERRSDSLHSVTDVQMKAGALWTEKGVWWECYDEWGIIWARFVL